MKPITEKDVFNNRFVEEIKKGVLKIKAPKYEEAKRMHKRTLCVFIAVSGLRLRPVAGAVDNANFWLKNSTKEEILNTFFC